MTLKPGTRCECRDEEHEGSDHKRYDMAHMAMLVWCQCKNDAVRMVTVRVDTPQVEGERYIGFDEYAVPMCDPCARWHEERAK